MASATYVAPFAGWKLGDRICYDEERRCSRAIKVGHSIPGSLMVVTSEKPPHGERVHAEVIRDHLVVTRNWPLGQVIMNPEGRNTVLDMIAIFEAVERDGRGRKVVMISSWYHIPRIILIRTAFWLFAWRTHRYQVRFRASWKAETPIRSVVHEILGTPKSVFEAIWRRRQANRAIFSVIGSNLGF